MSRIEDSDNNVVNMTLRQHGGRKQLGTGPRKFSRTWRSKRTDKMLRYPVKLTRDDNGTILVTAHGGRQLSGGGKPELRDNLASAILVCRASR
jgi:hypothetical protein